MFLKIMFHLKISLRAREKKKEYYENSNSGKFCHVTVHRTSKLGYRLIQSSANNGDAPRVRQIQISIFENHAPSQNILACSRETKNEDR